MPLAPRRGALRGADLLRLLRVHGHRARLRPGPRDRSRAELRSPLLGEERDRFLAEVAHLALVVDERLRLQTPLALDLRSRPAGARPAWSSRSSSPSSSSACGTARAIATSSSASSTARRSRSSSSSPVRARPGACPPPRERAHRRLLRLLVHLLPRPHGRRRPLRDRPHVRRPPPPGHPRALRLASVPRPRARLPDRGPRRPPRPPRAPPRRGARRAAAVGALVAPTTRSSARFFIFGIFDRTRFVYVQF